MDPHKTGPLNQPPPAHNVSTPSQYPPPQGMPMAQAISSGYSLPKPAHTGSSMGMAKSPQGQGLQTASVQKQVSSLPEKSYPMMPPKSATPPNHSPVSTPSMPKMPQIPSLIPSASSKVGCMPQPQQPYQQFQQRMNPQMHFQPQTAQQNLAMHTNQSQVNAHNMPPYPQAQSQKVQMPGQGITVTKADPSKGPTPPIPDLISITKPAASQPLPPSPLKTDVLQSQQSQVKTAQNVSVASKEAQKPNSNSEHPFVSTPPGTVQIGSENKPFSSAPAGKVIPPPVRMEVNKPTTPASDASSIPKKPEGQETKALPEQPASDKNIPVMGTNLNGVPVKPQLKTSPTVVSKTNEPPENKPIGEAPKKVLPTQSLTPTKPVTTATPKISPSAAVPPVKAPAVQVKPTVPVTPASPIKSSQQVMKPVVTPPKTIVAQATLQPAPISLQSPPKSGPVAVAKASTPAGPTSSVTTDCSSSTKSEMTKTDSCISQSRPAPEIEHSKAEIVHPKTQKTDSVSSKTVKVDSVVPKPEATIAKSSKLESTQTKAVKLESSSVKLPKPESSSARTSRVASLSPKVTKPEAPSPKSTPKKEMQPKVVKAKKAEQKKPERPTRTEATPKTSAEGERKSKRTRAPAPLYQSPSVESSLRIPKSLAVTPKSQERLVCFFKNEHVAVRNFDGAFYICQLAQNVFRGTHKLKIRWLSPTDETDTCELFKPDYYDMTDFDCILTSVRLERVDRTTFRLPPPERERIFNILHRALDKEQGIDTSKDDLAEDHPDGLDISLYKDEGQLKVKKPKRSPRNKRALSEDTTDEDSEEMKDLGDDSEDDKNQPSESEDSESEVEAPPPPKVQKTLTARTPRAGRAKAPAKKEAPPATKAATPRAPSMRTKRSAAVAAIAESSPAPPPAKVARTLRQTPKAPPAKQQAKPSPKTTRRTRK